MNCSLTDLGGFSAESYRTRDAPSFTPAEYPLDQRPGVGLREIRVGRHGKRPPGARCRPRLSFSSEPGLDARPRPCTRATSRNDGPTMRLSTPWQASRPCAWRAPPERWPPRRWAPRHCVSVPRTGPTARCCSARLPWASARVLGKRRGGAALGRRNPSCTRCCATSALPFTSHSPWLARHAVAVRAASAAPRAMLRSESTKSAGRMSPRCRM